MNRFNYFARITKVNEAKREVTGIIASEVPDLDNEILDYDTSKKFFMDWSEGIAKATGGKSVGNVREMHGNSAAGKLTMLTADDERKEFEAVAKVVDDAAWKKVLEGVYTGFSIGGKYVKKWADKVDETLKRYTANPYEVSLVDYPCNPDATFSVVKAAGGDDEIRKFATVAETDEERRYAVLAEKLLAKREQSEPVAAAIAALRGDTLEKGMYSVSWLARLLSDLNCLANDAAQESDIEGDDSEVPSKLKAGIKQLGGVLVQMAQEEVAEMVGDDAGDADNGEDVDVAQAADMMLAAVGDLAKDRVLTVDMNDEAQVTALAVALLAKQADADEPAMLPLMKVGAKFSQSTMGHLGAMHDALTKMVGDAFCAPDDAADKTAKTMGDLDQARAELEEQGKIMLALGKALGVDENEDGSPPELMKLATKVVELNKSLKSAQDKIEELSKKVAAPKGSVRAVEKGDDDLANVRKAATGKTGDEGDPASLPEDAPVVDVFKHIHATGGRPVSVNSLAKGTR
jgi:hypothetical protein